MIPKQKRIGDEADNIDVDEHLKNVGKLMGDVARKGSADQCVSILVIAGMIIRNAQSNPNIPTSAYFELRTANYIIEYARFGIIGHQGDAS